jgi:hypothetical protein
MGGPLGVQYAELWQELTQLNITWSEFMELYGTKPSRIELMNRSAGHFFKMVQDSLWEGLMLHIARLTDRSMVSGRTNLTLHNLPALIPDATVKARSPVPGRNGQDEVRSGLAQPSYRAS